MARSGGWVGVRKGGKEGGEGKRGGWEEFAGLFARTRTSGAVSPPRSCRIRTSESEISSNEGRLEGSLSQQRCARAA